MPFTDFAAYADPLRVPINGKWYEIPPVGAKDGQRLAVLIAENTPLGGDEFRSLLLGPVLQELLDDNVPDIELRRTVLTALSEFTGGRGAAEIMWETAGDPKALEAMKTREAAASSTPSPASGSGTRTKAKATRTRKSSNTGS